MLQAILIVINIGCSGKGEHAHQCTLASGRLQKLTGLQYTPICNFMLIQRKNVPVAKAKCLCEPNKNLAQPGRGVMQLAKLARRVH